MPRAHRCPVGGACGGGLDHKWVVTQMLSVGETGRVLGEHTDAQCCGGLRAPWAAAHSLWAGGAWAGPRPAAPSATELASLVWAEAGRVLP